MLGPQIGDDYPDDSPGFFPGVQRVISGLPGYPLTRCGSLVRRLCIAPPSGAGVCRLCIAPPSGVGVCRLCIASQQSPTYRSTVLSVPLSSPVDIQLRWPFWRLLQSPRLAVRACFFKYAVRAYRVLGAVGGGTQRFLAPVAPG